MLTSASYRIRTTREAIQEGYERAPEFHVLPADLDVLFKTLGAVENKLTEFRSLTPCEREMNLPVLRRHEDIFRYLFIIVRQDNGYCLWRKEIRYEE
ncbi:MAG: hypothetical protein WAP52_02000 [Candidatus Sungiibacteriota bacterium]